ncbi:rhomboid family intramembrane serine protease [Geomonas sp. Red32]|uniref:rhomboid family intramembrane serine protease n=1 Tax=Geomonas sp. Red32 TaxID=2912856 RepID=UPI00202CD66D|nr:rhomboid family intramembrane serine protease [Geomonas sp. Red32]MCM0080236.1 rhomboid family intramembrane serine protease [Geomonas sp. Red32]
MSRRAIYCSHCGRLIGSSDDRCPWCGARRPGLFASLGDLNRVDPDGQGLVKAIITVNVIFFLLSLVISHNRMGGMGMSLSPFSFLSPGERSLLVLGATGTVPMEIGGYWTLVSASYLHGGILHLLFNMMALRQIGPWVAMEYGPSRMFVIYTLSGVLGYLVSFLAGVPLTIGASAAICGLIGALYYFGRSSGGRYGMAVSKEVNGWLISLVLFGLVMPGINNWGHGGGVLGGVVLGKLLGYQQQRKENSVHRILMVITVLGTLAILGLAAFQALTYSPHGHSF